MLRCAPCSRTFYNAYNYNAHVKSPRCIANGADTSCTCDVCHQTFSRPRVLREHVAIKHPAIAKQRRFTCGICKKMFSNEKAWTHHRETEHISHHDFKLVKAAHLNQCQLLRSFLPTKVKSVSGALVYLFKRVKALLEALAVELNYFRCNVVLMVEMYKLNQFGEMDVLQTFPFRGQGFRVYPTISFAKDLAMACGDIDRAVEEFHAMVRVFFCI